MRACPVCGTPMLRYENPPRLKCPKEAEHYKHLEGQKLGKPGRNSNKGKKKK